MIDLRPPRSMTTEERLDQIAEILLNGCRRVIAKRKRADLHENPEQTTGLQAKIERSCN